ncbi:hypothetical protein TrST_g7957 [Triparma strigata]|uniref:Uncharacterized protein n=1 Tax=Triparma strigata TaxID=1606541 RepID=A0A9W7BP50_9STRA|nr:hypothetical protein TrST_g7957 [Triparma strigata]
MSRYRAQSYDTTDSFNSHQKKLNKPSFLTEVDTHPYNVNEPISPRTSQQQNPANIYDRRFEDEDTTRTRTFLYLWYDVTQALKLQRADKTQAMLQLTRSANAKMKVEVRGVMSSVIFGSWKNFAIRKKWRREELKRIREEEEMAERVEKERNDKIQRMERLSIRKNRMSWKHNSSSSRGSTPTTTLNPASGQTPPLTVEIETPANEPQPHSQPHTSNKSNEQLHHTHPNGRPRKPAGSPPKRAAVNFTRRQTYGYHVKRGRTESADDQLRFSMPLPDNTARLVKRLSNPPGYVPQFMRRDKAEEEAGEFGKQDGLFSSPNGNALFDTGSDHGSFEDTLVDMYKQHKKKVKKAAKQKKKEKRKTNVIGHGSPPLKKPHPPLSEKARERKITVRIEQNEAMNRLFHGLGANPANNSNNNNNDSQPETDSDPKSDPKFVRRGSQYKNRKKSVVIQQLQKEKANMLDYLDKLVRPLDVGLNQNLH